MNTLPNDWGSIKPPYDNFRKNQRKLRLVAHFLNRVVKAYVMHNIQYKKDIGVVDFPFTWGELQNQAIFYGAMRDACRKGIIVLPECPYEYKHRQKRISEKKKNRLDYWVILKTDNSLGMRNKPKTPVLALIEYKHVSAQLTNNWQAPNCTKHIRQIKTKGWEDNRNKLWGRNGLEKKLKRGQGQKNELREYLTSCGGPTPVVVLVNFLAVPIVQKKSNQPKKQKAPLMDKVQEKDFCDWKKEISEKLRSPNWEAVWWIGNNKQYEDRIQIDKTNTWHYEMYHGVYFFAELRQIKQ